MYFDKTLTKTDTRQEARVAQMCWRNRKSLATITTTLCVDWPTSVVEKGLTVFRVCGLGLWSPRLPLPWVWECMVVLAHSSALPDMRDGAGQEKGW